MINKSKEILLKKGFTYREIAFILDITERQAMNILNKDNKSLYNYLVLAYISKNDINELFELSNDEIENIKKRIDLLIKSTL